MNGDLSDKSVRESESLGGTASGPKASPKIADVVVLKTKRREVGEGQRRRDGKIEDEREEGTNVDLDLLEDVEDGGSSGSHLMDLRREERERKGKKGRKVESRTRRSVGRTT